MTQVMTRHGEIVVDIKLKKKLGDLTDEEHEIYRGLILHISSYLDENFKRENYGVFIPGENMDLPEEGSPEYNIMMSRLEQSTSTILYIDRKGRKKRLNRFPKFNRLRIKIANNLDFFFRLNFPFLFK